MFASSVRAPIRAAAASIELRGVVREGEGLRRSASNPNRGASLCLGILEPVLRDQHVGKTHIRFLEASSALAEGSLLVNEDAPLRSRSQFPAPNCGRPKGCLSDLSHRYCRCFGGLWLDTRLSIMQLCFGES